MPKKPVALVVLDLLSLILVPLAMLIIIVYTPVEVVMGWYKRCFTFTSPPPEAGMVCFILGAVGGAVLLTRRIRWIGFLLQPLKLAGVLHHCHLQRDDLETPDLEHVVGVGPAIDHNRDHDADLPGVFYPAPVSTPEARRRLELFRHTGGVNCPLTFFSIRLFRTIHPVVIAPADRTGGAFSMSPRMLNTLLLSLLVFTVLLVDLVWRRVRLAQLEFEMTREVE